MTDLQMAIKWLEEMKALAEQTIEESKKLPYAVNNIRHYKRIANCRALLDALRKEPVEIVLDHEGLKARPLDALRWIPVEESLPVDGIRVLVCMSRDVLPGVYYSPTKAWYFGMDNYPRDSVTHWRPLPAPPKDGE